MSASCVFCRILKGEIPGSFVYQGDTVSAILDLHPINPGHLLVIPNRHSEFFTELTDLESAQMFQLARHILIAAKASGLKCEGTNLFLSDGKVAGQEVGHAHLHLVPRFTDDGQRMGFRHSGQATRDTLDHISKSLRDHLKVPEFKVT